MTTRTITVAPDLDTFLDGQIAAGTYKCADDAVNEALQLLKIDIEKRKLAWRHAAKKPTPSIQMDHSFKRRSPADWQKGSVHSGLNPLKMSPFFSEPPK